MSHLRSIAIASSRTGTKKTKLDGLSGELLVESLPFPLNVKSIVRVEYILLRLVRPGVALPELQYIIHSVFAQSVSKLIFGRG